MLPRASFYVCQQAHTQKCHTWPACCQAHQCCSFLGYGLVTQSLPLCVSTGTHTKVPCLACLLSSPPVLQFSRLWPCYPDPPFMCVNRHTHKSAMPGLLAVKPTSAAVSRLWPCYPEPPFICASTSTHTKVPYLACLLSSPPVLQFSRLWPCYPEPPFMCVNAHTHTHCCRLQCPQTHTYTRTQTYTHT